MRCIQLGMTLALAGVVLLLLCGSGAWWLVGAALRPVERMRRQAAVEFSETGPGRSARCDGREGRDSLPCSVSARCIDMLDRVDVAVVRERLLVRSRVATKLLYASRRIQWIGLDLALSGPQIVEELAAALGDASEENEHLTRLADDLLVPSERPATGTFRCIAVRSRSSRCSPRRFDRNGARAAGSAHRIFRSPRPDAIVYLDPARYQAGAGRPALDNALRATPPGGGIEIAAEVGEREVRIWSLERLGQRFRRRVPAPSLRVPFARNHARSGRDAGGRARARRSSAPSPRRTADTPWRRYTREGARVTLVLPAPPPGRGASAERSAADPPEPTG